MLKKLIKCDTNVNIIYIPICIETNGLYKKCERRVDLVRVDIIEIHIFAS